MNYLINSLIIIKKQFLKLQSKIKPKYLNIYPIVFFWYGSNQGDGYIFRYFCGEGEMYGKSNMETYITICKNR